MNVDVCFFHIEKCMGSSLRRMLYDFFKNVYDESLIYMPEKHKITQNLITDKDLEFFKDRQYKVILCHCGFNTHNITDSFSKNCFSITCVREPINRLLSHYYFFNFPKTKKCLYEIEDENEVIKIIKSFGSVIFMRLSGNTFDMDVAKENLKFINCILLFEKFNEELEYFNNFLNNKYNISITIENKEINKRVTDYEEHMDKDLEIIYKHKELIKDIELYDMIVNMPLSERFKL